MIENQIIIYDIESIKSFLNKNTFDANNIKSIIIDIAKRYPITVNYVASEFKRAFANEKV